MSSLNFDISNMLLPEVYDHPVSSIELIETHISWVILTGDFAYKIKKPVDFGFLDFSTLEKRRHYCEQEVKLNQRLAPDLYLAVVTISGAREHPHVSSQSLDKETQVLEYAVKMKQFAQSAQLDRRLLDGRLEVAQMDAVADMVAGFHQVIARAGSAEPYGEIDAIYQPVAENFTQIRQNIASDDLTDRLNRLASWSQAECSRLKTVFKQRKADGFIRECHGDMHLRNLAWLNDKPVAFDCIEFNPSLRWIDVISEVAFLVMDLQHRQQSEMANRLLNRYLEVTGDYAGLHVLRFYLCYRALVRAKVAALQSAQAVTSGGVTSELMNEFSSYIELASDYADLDSADAGRSKLIIMRGLSASGKSTVSQRLLEVTGAIRIRSDVERKRLFSVNDNTVYGDELNAGIYTQQATRDTYEKLRHLAELVISSGYSIIIDAVFLKHEQRELFRLLAERLQVEYIIIEVTASPEILRQRIIQRKDDVSDANLKVLEGQLADWQILHEDEVGSSVNIDTGVSFDLENVARIIKAD
ncbi:MAG: AAA family ATPase [Proteobacteria bacterium]|nr:AAA family ATPase [Pseudomonadota bacterium]